MDLRKAIEKLNNLDAKDLKKIDLSKFKDYNFGRFKEDLASKPNLLIKGVLILITIACFIYSISRYVAESSAVHVKEAEIQQRLDMIQEKNAAELNFKTYLSKYPTVIPTNQLIGKISEFAEQAHVNIISFSPVKVSESDYITQYVINLDIEAKTYQDMVDFVNIIENAPYTLRINKWTGRARSASIKNTGQKDVPLDAFIEIGSIQLNDV